MRVFMVEEDFSFRVHRRAPVHVDRDIPLLALGFFVEITEPLMRDVIVPGSAPIQRSVTTHSPDPMMSPSLIYSIAGQLSCVALGFDAST